MKKNSSEKFGRPPGPKSIFWDSLSDVTFSPFAIPILVLQAAHPDIGAAVAKYSLYRQEPWKRLFRTGFSLARFVHGGKLGKLGIKESNNLKALHAHIKGTRLDGHDYHALTPETYRVVPDTFLYGLIRFREMIGDPLSSAQLELLFEEYIHLCLMFGLKRSVLENSLDEFREYFDELLRNTMGYNDTVSFLLGEMLEYGPAMKYIPLPGKWCRAIYHRIFYPRIRLFAIGFLDAKFREQYEISWTEQD